MQCLALLGKIDFGDLKAYILTARVLVEGSHLKQCLLQVLPLAKLTDLAALRKRSPSTVHRMNTRVV